MSEEIKNIILEIISKINKTDIADKIILFGSYANGTEGIDSDIDLLVLSDSDKSKKELYSELRVSCSNINMPLDIIIHSQNEYEKYSNQKNHFLNEIKNNGIVIYERK